MAAERPAEEATFEGFERALRELYAEFTFERAAAESGVDAGVLREVGDVVASAGTRLSTHNWRSAAAGNLGGWQVSRTLFLVSALLGAVAAEGGSICISLPATLPVHPSNPNFQWFKEPDFGTVLGTTDTLCFSDLEFSDSGTYVLTYDDGTGTVQYEIELIVGATLPIADWGWLGAALVLLVVGTACIVRNHWPTRIA